MLVSLPELHARFTERALAFVNQCINVVRGGRAVCMLAPHPIARHGAVVLCWADAC